MKGIVLRKGGNVFYCRKDQTIFPVLAEEKILRDETNSILGIRVTIQDITERKQAEEALRKAKRSLKL